MRLDLAQLASSVKRLIPLLFSAMRELALSSYPVHSHYLSTLSIPLILNNTSKQEGVRQLTLTLMLAVVDLVRK